MWAGNLVLKPVLPQQTGFWYQMANLEMAWLHPCITASKHRRNMCIYFYLNLLSKAPKDQFMLHRLAHLEHLFAQRRSSTVSLGVWLSAAVMATPTLWSWPAINLCFGIQTNAALAFTKHSRGDEVRLIWIQTFSCFSWYLLDFPVKAREVSEERRK